MDKLQLAIDALQAIEKLSRSQCSFEAIGGAAVHTAARALKAIQVTQAGSGCAGEGPEETGAARNVPPAPTQTVETVEDMATRVANEAAMPVIRSMYPSRSRGQMANEFRHFIITGALWQREQVAPEGLKVEDYHGCLTGDCPHDTQSECDLAVAMHKRVCRLVDRFLAWPLPPSVHSDTSVTDPDYGFPRSGTNLLTATEAEEMFEYVLAGECDRPGLSTG